MTPNQSKSFSSTDRTERRGLHAEFEAWAAHEDRFNLTMRESNGHRIYADERTLAAWDAWQAHSAINAELLEALKSLLEAHPYANDGRDGYSVLVTAAQVDACRFARAAIKKATA